MRRIVTAREQAEMLAPWREADSFGRTAGAKGPLPPNLTFQHHSDGFDPFPSFDPDNPVPPPGHKWVQFQEDLDENYDGDEDDYDKTREDNDVPFYLAAPNHKGLWHVRGADSGFRYDSDELRIHDQLPPGIRPEMSIDGWPTVSAHDGDRLAGYLQWIPRKESADRGGEIRNIQVHPDYQRRGVATALFDYVKTHHEPRLRHSDNVSLDGDAWSSYEKLRRKAAVDPVKYGIDPEDYHYRRDLGKWKPKVGDDGMVDLYHRTSPSRADSIMAHGFSPGMSGSPYSHPNDEVFFTTTPETRMGNRYGDALIHVRVPVHDVAFDTVWGEDSEEAWATVFPPDLKGLPTRRLA